MYYVHSFVCSQPRLYGVSIIFDSTLVLLLQKRVIVSNKTELGFRREPTHTHRLRLLEILGHLSLPIKRTLLEEAS